MNTDLNSFSNDNFRRIIQQYCEQLGWTVKIIDDGQAIVKFNMKSGTVQTLYIISFGTTLEFSVPSALRFNNLNDVPGNISTILLTANSRYKIGFWCLETISGKENFSIMHNAEFSLINIQYFHRVVIHLVTECERLEQSIYRTFN